jgi:hypothetical protein
MASAVAVALLSAASASGKVVSVVVTSQSRWVEGRAFGTAGSYEKLQGRITFAIDPLAKSNARIADVKLAPRNASGLVEFTSDFVILRPIDPARARPSVLFEILNRGHSQANGVFFSSPHGQPFKVEDLDRANLDDGFAFEHGFTVVWLGWQFDLAPGAIRLSAPVSSARSLVREAFVPDDEAVASGVDSLKTTNSYCAADALQPSATLSVESRFEGPAETLRRRAWSFAHVESGKPVDDACSIYLPGGFERGRMYQAVYQGAPAPVAGLGLAAVRDFASYLKYGGVDSPILNAARTKPRIIGYGYSQSARFLRQYLYQGFTADQDGRKTFDGLLIASAGAGRGSFNHRYAMPGEAGVSVMSDLRPVDLFPFTDGDETDPVTGQEGGLLDAAKRSHTLPKIVYTYSSSEYWARAGSLAYTTVDGRRERPLDPDSRLYFFAGAPHAHGPFPPDHGGPKGPAYANLVNFASSKWGFRALLLDLDDWVAAGRPPPPSVYPHLASNLVPYDAVHYPRVPDFATPTTMPPTWRIDFGPEFETQGVIDTEPPKLGPPFALRVPRVDGDGNDLGGVNLPFLAAPLGTYTGWNHEMTDLSGFHYLAGLIGSFKPFAITKAERLASGDSRLSIEERYRDRDDYLGRVKAAEAALIARRFLRPEDRYRIERDSGAVWDAVVGSSTRPAPSL